jgi:hypothetical protein
MTLPEREPSTATRPSALSAADRIARWLSGISWSSVRRLRPVLGSHAWTGTATSPAVSTVGPGPAMAAVPTVVFCQWCGRSLTVAHHTASHSASGPRHQATTAYRASVDSAARSIGKVRTGRPCSVPRSGPTNVARQTPENTSHELTVPSPSPPRLRNDADTTRSPFQLSASALTPAAWPPSAAAVRCSAWSQTRISPPRNPNATYPASPLTATESAPDGRGGSGRCRPAARSQSSTSPSSQTTAPIEPAASIATSVTAGPRLVRVRTARLFSAGVHKSRRPVPSPDRTRPPSALVATAATGVPVTDFFTCLACSSRSAKTRGRRRANSASAVAASAEPGSAAAASRNSSPARSSSCRSNCTEPRSRAPSAGDAPVSRTRAASRFVTSSSPVCTPDRHRCRPKL